MIPGETRPEGQARWREGRQSTITLLTGVGLTAILSFGYNVWCARQLGAAHYADFAAALGIVAILGYAMNPLALVTAQLASRYAAAGNIEWVATLYRAMQRRLGVAIFVAAVLLAPLASSVAAVFRFSSWNIVAIAGSMVAILLLLAVARTTLRSLQRFTAYTRGLVGESMLRLGVGIPLIWLAPTAPSALAGYILASAAVLIIHDRMLRRSWRGLTKKRSVKRRRPEQPYLPRKRHDRHYRTSARPLC